jgi:polyisoprenoid-binding protein YceI
MHVQPSKNMFLMMLVSATGFAGSYTVDADHTHVGFRVQHMMVSHTQGRFKKFEGAVVVDDKDPAKSTIDISIDAASVDTDQEKRDEHLRSADFFDAANHPKITFKSKQVKVVGPRQWQVKGDLTIRGVTKEIQLTVSEIGADVKDPWGGVRRGAVASATVNRKDFGLKWNAALEAGGVALADDVDINLDIELVKKA